MPSTRCRERGNAACCPFFFNESCSNTCYACRIVPPRRFLRSKRQRSPAFRTVSVRTAPGTVSVRTAPGILLAFLNRSCGDAC